jgi:2TM domain
MPDLLHDAAAARHPDTAACDDPARQQAIRQAGRRRRYRISAVVSGLGMLLLVLIWALSEYHNAGGWPTHGFGQGSGGHGVWSLWIFYPLGAWLVLLATGAWDVYLREPISEQQIQRETGRQAGTGK